MMQHLGGSLETGRRLEAASCMFHIKRDTTPVISRWYSMDAYSEEMVVVTDIGYEVMTRWPAEEIPVVKPGLE